MGRTTLRVRSRSRNISSGRPGVDVSSYTVNGAIVGSVYYMVDGSPVGIAENNAAVIIPALEIPEDGVDEVRVETQNTPASYQSGGAGVISLATKSGGNHFHGDGFVVVRPDVLAANEYFNKQSQLAMAWPTRPRRSIATRKARRLWTNQTRQALLFCGLRGDAAAAVRRLQRLHRAYQRGTDRGFLSRFLHDLRPNPAR